MSAEVIQFPQGEIVTDSALTAPGEIPSVHFVRITNPLLPSASRESKDMMWHAAQSLSGYLTQALGNHNSLLVSLNGVIVPPELYSTTLPRAGDYIVVAPAVLGGGVWRTLAEVAVMAAAVTASVFLGPEFLALGMTATMSTALAGISAGLISVGGNMLVSALMPMGPSNKSQTPSYAFQGPASLAQSGTPIPKGYGTFQWGGNVIASFIDIEGVNQYINALVCFGFGPCRSMTNIEINGKAIATYSNVQTFVRYGSNDQTPIPTFNRIVNGYPQDTQVTCAGGSVVVPGTGSLTQALQVDVVFPTGVFYITGDGNQVPAKVIYQVQYSPAGLGSWTPILQPRTTVDVVIYNTDGTVDTSATPTWGLNWTGCAPGAGILIRTDNGPHTPGDQQTITETITTYNADGSTYSYSQQFAGEWQPINTALNQVTVTDWMNGYVSFVDSTTQSVYNRTSVYGLTPGKYDVQITKYGSNNADNTVSFGDFDSPRRGQEVWIHSVNEITYQDLCYPNMILLGVRALATNQLAGANINVTALIEHGLRTLDENVLPSALQSYEENNPACVAADMMLDSLYGGGAYPGILPTNIERFIDEWLNWANNSDTLVPDGNGNSIRLAPFNGIFDNESNLWDALTTVGRMSRAMIVPMGLDYGVTVDQAQAPVQMFSMGNILSDSFTETWLDIDSRANQIEVQFADSTRSYKQDNPIVYMDPADVAAGAIVKNVKIDGKGITSPAQAWHLGHYKGLCNKLLLRTGSFKADTDSIACRVGSAVILQHDVPQWGWGGRTLTGASTSTLTVDRNDLPWDGVTAYSIIVLFPAVQRYTGTVSSVAADIDSSGLLIGTTVNLSAFDNLNRVTRAVINGSDCAILQSQPGQIVVTPPLGFTPVAGQTYVLYDTDVLQTATVSNVVQGAPGTQVLTLGTPFAAAPPDFSTYFYGVPSSQKIVTVSAIKKASENRSTIEWIDYNAGVYAIGTPTVGETTAQATTNPGVTNLAATEVVSIQSSGSYAVFASLTWAAGPNTAGVAVYGSFPGGAVKMLGRQTGTQTAWQFEVAPDVAWTFTVVGFDVNDNYAPFSTAPTVTFTAEGITANLLKGSTFQTGFAYWNIAPRSGDSFLPTFQDDGQATYTVAGTALTTAQTILTQIIPPSSWAIGDLLMLSSYFSVTGTPTGNLLAEILFQNAAGATIGSASATYAMGGAAVQLVRVNTAITTIPALTAQVSVLVSFGGTLNMPVGTIVSASHLLLEIPVPAQPLPSLWADIDAKGNVLETFQGGSSSNLRSQGSMLPIFVGSFPYSAVGGTITLTLNGEEIAWPDGGITTIQNTTITVTGLTAGTGYYFYLYFDVMLGVLAAANPSVGVGTPPICSIAHDAYAVAQCQLDGRVPLTTDGILIVAGSGSGGGGGTGSSAVSVGIMPTSATLSFSGGNQTFTATVSGASNMAVIWSILPGGSGGTISSSGIFTGPGTGGYGSCGIQATSVANGSCYATASVMW